MFPVQHCEKCCFNDSSEEWENPELPLKSLRRFSHVQQSIRHLYIPLLLNFLKTCKLLILTEWWYTELTLMQTSQRSMYTTILNNEKFFWEEACNTPPLSDYKSLASRTCVYEPTSAPSERTATHLPEPEVACEAPHSHMMPVSSLCSRWKIFLHSVTTANCIKAFPLNVPNKGSISRWTG